MEDKVILYEEVQQMRQWWLWLIVVLCASPFWLILLYQLYTGTSVGEKPASNLLLLCMSVVVTLPLIAIFYFLKLTTRIDSQGISYGFNFPTDELNHIPWPEVRSLELITYTSTGYGYRISRRYGTVYNTSGNRGLLITHGQGRTLLLGTNNEEELVRVLKALRKM